MREIGWNERRRARHLAVEGKTPKWYYIMLWTGGLAGIAGLQWMKSGLPVAAALMILGFSVALATVVCDFLRVCSLYRAYLKEYRETGKFPELEAKR